MSMTMAKLKRVAVLASLVSLGACGGHPWRIVHEAPPPSPLKGAGPVTVSFDYSKITIGGKSEAQWVQDKTTEDADYPKKWTELKGSLENHFIMGFAEGWKAGAQPGPAGAPGVHVVVAPTSLGIGHYMVFAATPTVVTTNIVYAVDGKDAEEISTNAERFASVIEPSVFQHIPLVGATLGRYGAKFLTSKN
jgi:hypothetical protein